MQHEARYVPATTWSPSLSRANRHGLGALHEARPVVQRRHRVIDEVEAGEVAPRAEAMRSESRSCGVSTVPSAFATTTVWRRTSAEGARVVRQADLVKATG